MLTLIYGEKPRFALVCGKNFFGVRHCKESHYLKGKNLAKKGYTSKVI